MLVWLSDRANLPRNILRAAKQAGQEVRMLRPYAKSIDLMGIVGGLSVSSKVILGTDLPPTDAFPMILFFKCSFPEAAVFAKWRCAPKDANQSALYQLVDVWFSDFSMRVKTRGAGLSFNCTVLHTRNLQKFLEMPGNFIAKDSRLGRLHTTFELISFATQPQPKKNACELMEAALSRVARLGHSRVAIYGAGKHTQKVAAALASATVHIPVIMDDSPKDARPFFNVPIVSPRDVTKYNVQAVIFSSDEYESQMRKHTRFFESKGIECFPLYAQGTQRDTRS